MGGVREKVCNLPYFSSSIRKGGYARDCVVLSLHNCRTATYRHLAKLVETHVLLSSNGEILKLCEFFLTRNFAGKRLLVR